MRRFILDKAFITGNPRYISDTCIANLYEKITANGVTSIGFSLQLTDEYQTDKITMIYVLVAAKRAFGITNGILALQFTDVRDKISERYQKGKVM